MRALTAIASAGLRSPGCREPSRYEVSSSSMVLNVLKKYEHNLGHKYKNFLSDRRDFHGSIGSNALRDDVIMFCTKGISTYLSPPFASFRATWNWPFSGNMSWRK